MRSTIVKNELVVGAFVAIAVLLGVFYVLKKTREVGLLDVRRINFTVAEGAGLEKGAPVLMRGIEVGSIDDIQLTKDHRVRVTASIAPRFAQHVTSAARASVVEPPLLGSTKVELLPGDGGDPDGTDDLETFTSENLFGRFEAMEGRVNDVIAKIDSFVNTANSTLTSVDKIAKAVEDSRGLAGRLINDPKLADDAEALLRDLREITHSIREGEGVLAMTINDGDFAEDLRSTAKSVRTITDDIEAGKGSLGRLYKETELLDQTEGMIKDVRGSLAKLNTLNDEATTSIKKVQALLDKTTSTMGKVDTVISSAGDVTGELTKTIQKINEGDGTIAALLNDRALYMETKSLLKELRESVEDLREQAPINSFIGVVFSAF
jgi:phospholipid/cholesterol/gamma-HCH transport system substrate-binding protein